MIRHCVMLRLPDDYDRDELDLVMQGLDAIAMRLVGCCGFLSGVNIDLEHKSPDLPFGFTLDFDDVAALQRYAADEEHIALGGRLVRLCGGADNIVVFDLQGHV